ncbi:MAG: redoxin domain-containing protein [Chthonomonas sp.]|nr:redoxin domain-containing protein [Chthonomonas sp.]
MALTVGTIAPDFTLRSLSTGELEDRTLSSHRGQSNVVLLFFPAAFTGVCTQEMCDVTNGLGAFGDADAVVYGISGDTAFAQAAWAEQNGIKVSLLSDYSKKTSQAYDVVLPDLAGHGPAAKRAAFVVDKQGVIRYAEETPTPVDLPNFDAVRAALAELG